MVYVEGGMDKCLVGLGATGAMCSQEGLDESIGMDLVGKMEVLAKQSRLLGIGHNRWCQMIAKKRLILCQSSYLISHH
jgi:hypothetical protein